MEQQSDERQSVALADAYLSEGRVQEALFFLAKAEASDRLQELADQATADGDAFLLKQIGDLLKQDYDAAKWLSLAEAAEAGGKLLYAEVARRHARSIEA
ncbi:MAG: hypothetical protein VX252_02035 [Myxococcota bacterium]|nr:hypothetical protein [Myxococcota bacterium]